MKKMNLYRFVAFGMAVVAMLMPANAQTDDDDLDAWTDTATVVRHAAKKTKKVVPTREIVGRVVTAQDRAALAGVLVQSVGCEGYSALTEDDGSFRIAVPLHCSALEVQAPGYNRVRIGVNKSGRLRDVVLQSEQAPAFYEGDDNIFMNATAKDFKFSHAVNVGTEVENRLLADIYTVERGGLSGIGSYMQIDGVGSLMSNAQPLVVIDGVVTEMQYGREMLHSGFYHDLLTNLNVYDIESIEIQKNGTAIYGAQGANGVIYIKTKRSKSLATRIDAFANVGVELAPSGYEMMNGMQFKTYASNLLSTVNTQQQSFKFLEADPNYYWYKKYNNNTDWGKEVFQPTIRQRYGLTVQGGGELANYMLSIGYTHSGETIKEGNFDRLNARFNTDMKLSDWVKIHFDASFTNTTRKLYDTGAPTDYDNATITSLNFLGYAKSPMLSPYSFIPSETGQGTLNDVHYDTETEDYLSSVSELSNSNYELANPSAILTYGTAPNKNYYDESLINIAITPEWQPNKHLKFSTLFSYSLNNLNEKHYIPINGVPSFYVQAYNMKMANRISSLFSRQSSIYSDTKVQWTNNYDGHAIDLTGGFRYQNEGYSLTQQVGYNTGNDKTPLINNASYRSIEGTTENLAKMAWYGVAKYNYANRYYLQGDLAVETNSQFGSTAKGLKMAGVVWGVFPSIQAGWVMSNEKWFNVKGIDYLKLVTGYGVSGNDNLPYDASKSYFNGSLYLKQVVGLSFNNIGNTDLKWETSRKFNVGLEGRFFHNRLELGVNYYHTWTSDLLTLRSLNFLSGIDQSWCNGGSLENKGVSAHMNIHLISGNKWNWTLGASVGHYKNVLTSLPDGNYIDTEVLGGVVRSEVGGSINRFYGLQTDKTASGNIVYATTAEAQLDGLYRLNTDGSKTYFEAGDVKYVDQNHDGCIDDRDRVFIGDANPTVYGNITTSLSYRRVRLDVGFNYRVGGDIYNYTRQQLESESRFMNQTTAVLSRWVYEGQNTDIPRATYADPKGNSAFSDRWIEDGSFLKLKNITLSYELPINNTYIQGLTIWAQATNVLTLTKYLGTDPEVSISNSVLYQGVDGGWLSQGRMFHLGIKINL